MQQVSMRLVQAGDFPALLTEILEAAIEITGTHQVTQPRSLGPPRQIPRLPVATAV
jgi:hypothetical protein